MNQPPQNVVELQINLDDATGELVGAVVQSQLDGGALDAWVVPIQMKKGRPGMMLCVLSDRESAPQRARDLIRQTGSFGVRYRPWERCVLDRRHEQMQTAWGSIRIKVGAMDGQDLVAKPEFADVQQLAESAGVPVRVVLAEANRLATGWIGQAKEGEA